MQTAQRAGAKALKSNVSLTDRAITGPERLRLSLSRLQPATADSTVNAT